MAIYPGGKSVRINSPRHLTLRHNRRAVATYQRRLLRQSRAASSQDDGDEVDPLPPGSQKLNSYWAPGLEAGQKHVVSVSQTVTASNQALELEAEQDFFVDAPQYSLPDGMVHSTYPPAGYADDHRILPHIVLTDPHLPWERLGSPSSGTNAQLRAKVRLNAAAKDRNRVPWLVMFSFSQDELRLSPDNLVNFFKDTSSGVIKPVVQTPTMTVNMSIEDLWKLSADVTTPVTKDLGPEPMKDSRGDFIFVPSDLFTSLFSTFDINGNRVVPSTPDTSQYKYLSHVRTINGSGMALAGVEDTAVFSIVVGNRAGPLDNVGPTTMTAHLVSIEGVEDMKKFPSGGQRYVALCSLYSWNYTVLPPDTLNVPDAFEHLGQTLDVLRAPEDIIAPLRSSSDKVRQRIGKRMDDGYTLVKYYTQTGEPTIALYRSPLIPTWVSSLDNLTQSSNTGVDLQILDKELGIMDITYSVAWQLGRTMALGDESFVAALGRLRTAIHTPAVRQVKLQTVKEVDDNAVRTRNDVLADLPSMVKSLAAIHLDSRDPNAPLVPAPGQPFFRPGGAKKRWYRRRLEHADTPNLSFLSPSFDAKYTKAAQETARKLAGSKTGDNSLYDETNNPLSSDWMIVLSWLVDRMFLAGIPAHCLISDPTHLQNENLRFFRIDEYYIDALIDGALSLGNQNLVDHDRKAIKDALNEYITHTPEGMDHPIQIPAYGFYLRSDLVTMFPDLRVEVLADEKALKASNENPPSGAPLLRHEIVSDGVMMGLMDRLPGSAQFASLVFTQPAHQQRFAVSRGVDTEQIKVDIRRQYTVDQAIRDADPNTGKIVHQFICKPTGDESKDSLFVWGSRPNAGLNDLRILRLPRFADAQLKELQDGMGTYNDGGMQKPYFKDDASTSALLAMQLNDPVYNLTIDLQPHSKASALADLGGPPRSAPAEVRTLKRLTPARTRTSLALGAGGPAGGSCPAKAEVEDSQPATFQRPASYIPSPTALSTDLAPNLRALRKMRSGPLPPAKDPPAAPPGDPAGPPEYDITVSSNNGTIWNSIVLNKPNLQQDLIFSVIVRQNPSNEYLLVEMDIEIKFGPAASSPGDTKFLMPNYTGPGAIMLRNLRFNILPQLLDDDKGEPVLRLRLLPRAAKGWIDTKSVQELGFLLGLASVNGTDQSNYQVEIASWAIYCSNPDDPKIGPGNTFRVDANPTLVTVWRD
ncbi:hypothetical protein ESCO_005595 [Escovopsis weberi]|uniref:Uncharacterized protein n=1 Tax=Escovopsis weberi TaxID=150374 RepID=A0A0M9VUI0_ESCWE|nr:hypothetical protein ESCO_005595 [Escovopsis weberi]